MSAPTRLPLALLLFGLTSCALIERSGEDPAPASPSHAEAVATILIGEFSSARQAESDGRYFPIRLRHIPIWSSRDDGPWLYVEQAVETSLERPYRQRIYRIVELDGGARSDVYELPGDLNAYVRKSADAFDALRPEQLSILDGCSISLQPGEDGHFIGGTTGEGCRTTRQGASYTTSEVDLSHDALRTWDRGWAASGEQAWGAEAGPYVFERLDID